MPTPRALVQRTGALALRGARPLWRTAVVLDEALRSLGRLSFLNTACYRSLIRQIHDTAVAALPMTCFVALVLGSITVHYLLTVFTGLGAYDRIGEYLVDSMLHEIAPVTVAVILMVRSGTTVLAEVGLMSAHGELDTIRSLGIPLRDYVYLPRVLAFALAGPSLTLVFSLVGVVGGFLVMGYTQDITLGGYLDLITDALELKDLFYVTAKPLLLALGLAGICIQRGLSTAAGFADLPRLLIQSLGYGLACIVGVEVVFIFLG